MKASILQGSKGGTNLFCYVFVFKTGPHFVVTARLELTLYPSWPQTHNGSPASAPQVLELQGCATVVPPGNINFIISTIFSTSHDL